MRILIKLIIFLIFLIGLSLAALLTALQSSYAPQMLTSTFNSLFDQKIEIRDVQYQWETPNSIELTDVNFINPQDQNLDLNVHLIKLEVELDSLFSAQLKIPQLSLQGLDLTNHAIFKSIKQRSSHWPFTTQVDHLSIENLEFKSSAGWLVRDAKLEIDQPSWNLPKEKISKDISKETEVVGLPFPLAGKIQANIDQIYWQGISVDNLVLDAQISPQETSIYVLAFDWQQGKVRLRGIQSTPSKPWQVEQAEISQARLGKDDFTRFYDAFTKEYKTHQPVKFSEFELKDISLQSSDFSLEHVNLSATGLNLPQSIWQQNNAKISATADALGIYGTLIEKPSLDAVLTPQRININQAALRTLQGSLDFSGQFSPDSVNLKQFNARNIRWFPSESAKHSWQRYLNALTDAKIDDLNITNIQYTDVKKDPKVQFSGLSLIAKQLHFIEDSRWGLWQGKLEASANQISYDALTSDQPLIKLENNEKRLKLTELFLPLADGLVKGTGWVQVDQLSQPFELSINADGVPLRLYSRWLQQSPDFRWPMTIDGFSQAQLKLNGLAGDEISFRHSLNGELTLNAADVIVAQSNDEIYKRHNTVDQTVINLPYPERNEVEMTTLKVTADRGRIHLTPFEISNDRFDITLKGDYDLVNQTSNINYLYTKDCTEIRFDPTQTDKPKRSICPSIMPVESDGSEPESIEPKPLQTPVNLSEKLD